MTLRCRKALNVGATILVGFWRRRKNVSDWRVCANRAGFEPPASVLRRAWAVAAGAHRQSDRLSLLQRQAVAPSQQYSRAQGTWPIAGRDRSAAQGPGFPCGA